MRKKGNKVKMPFDDRVFKMLKDLAQAKGDKKEIILIRLRFNKDILDNTVWWKFGRRRAAMFWIHEALDDLVKLPVALGVAGRIGLLAELIKKQTNRDYFSKLPVGTKFIIVDEVDLPGYDLTGYFLKCRPHVLSLGNYFFIGYIERGSWRIIGEIKNNIGILRS